MNESPSLPPEFLLFDVNATSQDEGHLIENSLTCFSLEKTHQMIRRTNQMSENVHNMYNTFCSVSFGVLA